MKKKFYFSYGSWDGYPYCGGYTLVHALDFKTAIDIFKFKHPCSAEGILNCAFFYSEEELNNPDELGCCHEELY